MRGLADLRSSILDNSIAVSLAIVGTIDRCSTHSVVLILSKGVTASNDSVMPAPKPAMTVRGPEILPISSCNKVLYVSNATKPASREPRSSSRSLNLHTYPGFERIANDQGGAACIPGLSERRPSQLLAVW